MSSPSDLTPPSPLERVGVRSLLSFNYPIFKLHMLAYPRYILTLLLLTISTLSFAGRRAFFGRIINTAGAGLPSGAITSRDGRYQFFVDAKGAFNFKADADSIDFFVFSAVGYDKREFLVEDLVEDSIIVELQKHKNVMDEASVSARGRKMKTATAGIGSGLHSTSCYLNVYDEIAVYLPADRAKRGFIKEVGAYITHEGNPHSNFKLHLYARDSATGGPGDEITDTVLEVHGRHGNDWVAADISDKHLQVQGGIYVSVEWIIDNTDAFTPHFVPPGNSNYYAGNDSLKGLYTEQVLGLAWQDEQPKVYRRYATNFYTHKDAGKWYLTPPLRGGHKGHDWITPMIYYTYSYLGE